MTPYQLETIRRACDHVQRLCRDGRTFEASNHLERLAAWFLDACLGRFIELSGKVNHE